MPLYSGQQDPLTHVVSFLETTVFGYAVGDIRRLGQVRPDPIPPNLRGCTVPECLSIFAVLDLLGFLMRGDFDDEKELDLDRLIADQMKYAPPPASDNKILKRISEKACKSSDNLKYMLKKWLSEQSKDYDELNRHLIIKLFRNGGAHQFIPKAAGIAKWGLDHPLIEFWKADDGFPKPILNEDLFRQDFLETVDHIALVLKNKDEQTEENLRRHRGGIGKENEHTFGHRHWLDRDMLRTILGSRKPDLMHSRSFQTLPTV